MERRRVVITGLGAVTPIGLTAGESWQAVKNGVCGIGPITHYDPAAQKVKLAAEVKGFDPEALLGRQESKRMGRFTQFAVAAARAIERVSGVYPGIKWTNDLVLNGRKLCGILTELSVEGETGALQYVVPGIGINVSQCEEDFDGDVAQIATSILRETGRRISRAELAAAMIEELDALYAALKSGDTSAYLEEYRRRCVTIGREVQLLWQDTKEKVTALDVDEEFGLIVRRENGTVETVRTGEVSVRGLYGYVE